MSFKHDMRATTTEYLRRLAEHDAKVEKFKEENKRRLTAAYHGLAFFHLNLCPFFTAF